MLIRVMWRGGPGSAPACSGITTRSAWCGRRVVPTPAIATTPTRTSGGSSMSRACGHWACHCAKSGARWTSPVSRPRSSSATSSGRRGTHRGRDGAAHATGPDRAAEPAGWEDVLQTVALLQALGSKSAATRQRAALSSTEEAPVPVEALVEAALTETDPNVAGALRWALARSGDADSRCWRRDSPPGTPRCANVPSGPSPRSRTMRRPHR